MVKITSEKFGSTKEGEEVFLTTMKNSKGFMAGILDYGGTLVFLKVPDQEGHLTDIVLGYDHLEDYEKQDKYFGAILGRSANRIADGKFHLNGQEYQLLCNNQKNHLHGGRVGFNKRVWRTEVIGDTVELSYFSPDQEEGYPGNLNVKVCYKITENNELSIEYQAKCDADTVCNLSNHSYFNLNGHNSGMIEDHILKLASRYYTPIDENMIPTGVIEQVDHTPMDFRDWTGIGDRINEAFEQIRRAGGYDHNFAVDGYDTSLKIAAKVFSPKSGIQMEVFTTMPGLQLYTGNFLDGDTVAKQGTRYDKRNGFCLETQFFPDALNHASFVQPILRKGDLYHEKTVYRFELKEQV